jgi:hypothetical protein
MYAGSDQSSGHSGDTPRLRAACENCRQSKVKCNLSGKSTCIRCLRHGLPCRYRLANRSGKPKGSRNRATLKKLGQLPDEKPVLRALKGKHNPDIVMDNHSHTICERSRVLQSNEENVCSDPVNRSGRMLTTSHSFTRALAARTPTSRRTPPHRCSHILPFKNRRCLQIRYICKRPCHRPFFKRSLSPKASQAVPSQSTSPMHRNRRVHVEEQWCFI